MQTIVIIEHETDQHLVGWSAGINQPFFVPRHVSVLNYSNWLVVHHDESRPWIYVYIIYCIWYNIRILTIWCYCVVGFYLCLFNTSGLILYTVHCTLVRTLTAMLNRRNIFNYCVYDARGLQTHVIRYPTLVGNSCPCELIIPLFAVAEKKIHVEMGR